MVSILFFMSPRQLPESAAIKEERRKELAKVLADDLTRDMNFKEMIKVFPRHLKELILSPSYMFLAFALATLLFLFTGYIDFTIPYLETQFGLTDSAASLVVGIEGIIGPGQSQIVGVS